MNYQIMVYGKPAHNTRLTLRRPMGGSGVQKTAVGAMRLCAVFSHPHSSPPQTYGLLYKVGWNVVNLKRYATVAQNL